MTRLRLTQYRRQPVIMRPQIPHHWGTLCFKGLVWGVWSPRLADSRDPGLPGGVPGGGLPFFPSIRCLCENAVFFAVFWPCRSAYSGAGVAMPCLALPCLPCACPALPALLLSSCLRAALAGRDNWCVCWKPLLFAERPAQAARTHNLTLIHLSCGLL